MKSKKSQTSAKLNVLFIGNSFTARNDLPGLIAQLAGGRVKRGFAMNHGMAAA